jgi:membrane protein implicated in regulation of membrane protease activity
MNWELFYLICFVVGFAFSVISFLSGTLNSHVHLPKHLHFGGSGHGHGSGHGTGHGAAHSAGHSHGDTGGVKGAHFSFLNPMTFAAFLTWFGGAGYLLVHLRHIWVYAGLALASLAGLIAAALVFWFVAKVLMANERDLDPLDYDMIGVLGYVSSTVRKGGTGEMIFVQLGVRKPCAARSESGDPLAKGEEVVVTRYEQGIAYVRRWDELAGAADVSPKQEIKS